MINMDNMIIWIMITAYIKNKLNTNCEMIIQFMYFKMAISKYKV